MRTERMGTSRAFQIRESLRRDRAMELADVHSEHISARDKAMRSARDWRQFAFDSNDIGGLYQADAWIKCARRLNHHALATRPERAA